MKGWYGHTREHRIAALKNRIKRQPSSDDIKDQGYQYFRSYKKIPRYEKVDDLLENADTILEATPENLEKWKKNIRDVDLDGVDTYDLDKANELVEEYDTVETFEEKDREAVRTWFNAHPHLAARRDYQELISLASHLYSKGIAPDKIDWASAPKDRSLREWLEEEYGLYGLR